MRRTRNQIIAMVMAILMTINMVDLSAVVHASGRTEVAQLTVGSLNTTTGQTVSAKTRCRSERYDLDAFEVNVNLGEVPAKYGVYCYDTAGEFLGWTGWLTTNNYQTLDNTRYIRLVICYTNSRNIGSVELAELGNLVTITAIEIEVTGIALSETAVTLMPEESVALEAMVTPEDATDKSVIWSSSNDNVATVTDGVVVAVTAGNATITATTVNGINATCEVTVEVPRPVVQLTLGTINTTTGNATTAKTRCRSDRYDLKTSEITVDLGNVPAKYGVYCYNASKEYIGWTNWLTTSDYPLLDDTRYVRFVFAYNNGRSIGEAELVELGRLITVTELEPVIEATGITLSETAVTIAPEESIELMAVIEPEDTEDKSVTWSSSDDNVATVSNGIVAAIAAGTATITATTVNGISATCEVTVEEPEPEIVKLTVGSLSTTTGKTVTAKTRCRSDRYDLNAVNIAVNLGEIPAKYGMFCYDASGTFLGWTSWLTTGNYQTLENTRYIRLLFAYKDSRNIGESELAELGRCISLSEAQVEVPTHTVTYDAGQGTFASNNSHTVSVTADEGYFYLNTLEEEPVWENHEFKGWLYEGRYVEGVALNSDVTLTAQWLETYSLTYDANGGGWDQNPTGGYGATTLTRRVGPGTHYVDYVMNERIEDPVRAGYRFVGWKYGDKIVRKVKVSGPTTLVAVWEGAIAVTYDANGGFWQFDNDPEFTTVTQQEPAGLCYIGWHEPQRAGYEFVCWTMDDEPVWKINLTEPITVKARWTKKVTVKYHPNGGSWNGSSTPQVVTDIYTGDYWVGHDQPQRDGYCFLGWSTNAQATTAEWGYEFKLKDDTTFYAIWGANPVVTYDANGGWFENGGLTESVERNFGRYRLEGYGVRRDGWEFLGWALSANGGVAYTRDEEIDLTQSMMLYAVWKQYPMVIYDANGGGWGWYEDEEGYIQYHQTWKMHWDEAGHYYYVGMESPEMPGYEFDGWYFPTGGRADDVAILLEDEQTYVVEAHWVKKCTVTYKTTPGGWGWFDGERYEYDVFTREATEGEYQIEGWTPNREGPYKFMGYTTVENGTQAQYFANQKITISDDLTLYAVWKQLPTIIYDGNGGGWGSIVTEDGRAYADVVRYDWREPGHVYYVGFEEPWRDGYIFECWVDAQGNRVNENRLDLEDGDVYTFYAKWKEPVTVTYKTYIGGYGWYDWNTEEYECTTFDREEWTGDYNLDGWWPNACDEPYKFLGYAMGHDHYQIGQVDYQPNDHLILSEDVTFYAVWMRMPTVTYRGNGGGWGDLIETENGGTTYKKTVKMDWREPGYVYYVGFEQPWREGYEFDGWVDAQGNRADDRRIDFTGTTAETFYASWKKEITITYENGGFGGWGMYDRYNDTYEHTSITNTVWTNEEYCVDGWEPYCGGYPCRFMGYALGEEHANYGIVDYRPGDLIPLDANSEDMTLYAIWHEIAHVKYDANGGGWGRISTGENDTAWEYYETVRREWRNLKEYYTYIRQENPWREGYEFGGWVDANGASMDNQEIHFYEYSVSQTVYAKWLSKVTVTYDANGGSFFGHDVNTPGETDYVHYRDGYEGEYYFDGWTPFRDDYVFAGWSTTQDGEPLSNPVTLQGSTTFYAVWQAKPVVTYDANGGGWGMEYGENGVTYEETTKEESAELGDYNVGLYWPERDGYEFVGWAETPNAQTAESDWETTLTGSTTFYAIWNKLAIVTYNPGPNAKFSDNSTIKTKYVDKGSWFNLGWYDEIEPIREGYRFDGWLYNGNAYDSIRVDDDVTLDADWVKTYELKFNANGGYYDGDANFTICVWEVDDGEGYDFWVYEAPIPEREGCIFGGWRLNGVNVNSVEIDGSDVTIYAYWLDENGQPMG